MSFTSSPGPDAAEEAAASECTACGASGLEAFYETPPVPTQSCVLLDDAESAAAYPRGDLLLAVCPGCGFIQNVRFDPAKVDYSQPTEESQAFSPRFQAFAAGLADELVARHRLVGRSVLEVGCGKGDFLGLLAERGIGRGVGIDPGFLPERAEAGGECLHFRREHYGPRHRDLTADLILTRHLMEHVPNVGEFFGWLADSTAATPGAVLVTEVPDVRRVLDERAFWDIYYEHCSYFTLGSLGRTLRAAGMTVERLETAFGDQYLLAESRPGGAADPHPAEEPVAETLAAVRSFAPAAAREVDRWRRRLGTILGGGGHVVLWGGGSKAVAFLTTLGLDGEGVSVVDINPHKQGRFLPGTAVKVEAPDVLASRTPDLVVVMNAIYTEEITADLERMGVTAPVQALG